MNLSDAESRAWTAQAACKGMPADLFLPEGIGKGHKAYVEARAVCAGCPVTQACLNYAVATGQRLGMWGGTTPTERRRSHPASARRWIRICGAPKCGITFEATASHQLYCCVPCRRAGTAARRSNEARGR